MNWVDTVSDSAVDITALLVIGYMVSTGVLGYEPLAAVVTIATGRRYLKTRTA
jgi:hypothetical protein